MTWIPVQSSAIKAVAYEHNNLFVRFKDGDEYLYEEVTWAEYRALLTARSRGRYLNLNIKPRHSYRKL